MVMGYYDASDIYVKQYMFGKADNTECIFPYNLHYIDDNFVKTTIDINIIKYNTPDEDKVLKYMDMLLNGSVMGETWVSYGKRMKNGSVQPFWHNTFVVLDGTHRTDARKRIGEQCCDVIMPLTHYNLYNEVIK